MTLVLYYHSYDPPFVFQFKDDNGVIINLSYFYFPSIELEIGSYTLNENLFLIILFLYKNTSKSESYF